MRCKLDETVFLQSNNFRCERVLIEIDLNRTILNRCPWASNTVGDRVLFAIGTKLKSIVPVVQANHFGVIASAASHDQLTLGITVQGLEAIQVERRQFIKPFDAPLLATEKHAIRNCVQYLSQRGNFSALLTGMLAQFTDHSPPKCHNVEQHRDHKHENQNLQEISHSAPPKDRSLTAS